MYLPQDAISVSAYDATTVSQRERNALTCFNEKKVQIKNVKNGNFHYPPTCLPALILAIMMTNTTNLTILRWQPSTVHISYMAFVVRLKQEMKF